MSLMDGLLLDSLLNPPVVKQEVWLANRTDSPAKGAGTQADPYLAGGGATDSDPIFDQVMRAITATSSLSNPVTVRLQPGTYYTKGWSQAYSAGAGWMVTSGMRIVGSGMGVTTIKLVSNLANATAASLVSAVAMNPFYDEVEGFELSDLTIDANLGANSAANLCVGGVSVTGKNIFVRRVEVLGFGNKGTSADPALGISVARAALGMEAYNCVIEACIVREPGGTTSRGSIALHLGTVESDTYHTACVIRDCLVDLSAGGATDFTKAYLGIAAGEGYATIVANNEVRNCQYGITWGGYATSAAITYDLVIRGNLCTNVAKVLVDPGGGSGASIERLIVLKNTAEWPATSDYDTPIGLELDGGSSSSTTIFKSIIVRNNVFRRPVGSTPSNNEKGIHFKNCSEVIAENNVAEVGTSPNNGVWHEVCDKVKVFNNRKPDTTFLPAYYITGNSHLAELTTDVEDALLAI